MPTVTMIPATRDLRTRMPLHTVKRRRVAAYARVSTDSDEQFTSYEAQIDYYTNYIRNHEGWDFAGIYADEGISGTSTKRRDGFNSMIRDALDGKIDLIISKSVSRFARNTVDSLTIIRQLKDAGVECFFEKENIYTFDGKGELLLTIMSSLAQEESRSLSENVTWGKRKSFADGKVSMPYKNFLGYEKGPDGKPAVNAEEARLVLRIYETYLSGKTAHAIAKELTAEGIPTPAGKTVWRVSTIESILTNEKYRGDALLQKKITVDFLSKKTKSNEGEVPQYYVHESHPAIVPPQLFESVQLEMARRKKIGSRYSGKSIFSCRIICGDCGSYYGAKVWNSTDEYRRTVWRCNRKYSGETKCRTQRLTEDELRGKFLIAYNWMLKNREKMIRDCLAKQRELTECTDLNKEAEALCEEMERTADLLKQHLESNTKRAQSQTEWNETYQMLTALLDEAKRRYWEVQEELAESNARADALGVFIFDLREHSGELTYFDPRLWSDSIENVTVYHDGKLKFRFISGTEFTV